LNIGNEKSNSFLSAVVQAINCVQNFIGISDGLVAVSNSLTF
jgi:hypothetical protein